jgi:peptidoglycan hydrolase CwlO-like protein
MPPVKTVASTSDVDNEATAELPVLDVAAYEATLNESVASTDSWTAPAPAVDLTATQSLPAMDVGAIPTLQAAEAESLVDLSGTHEMPPLARPNKIIKATPATLPRPASVPRATPATQAPPVAAAAQPVESESFTAPTAPAAHVLPPAPVKPVVLPPSPPLIEELRGALAAAERRIEELNERARIADAERGVAVARVTAENQQLREQLAVHLESLHSSRGRLDAQRADQSALEDELFASADRIDGLRAELAAQAEVLASVRAALDSREQNRTRVDADLVNLRATLERRDTRIGVLEADLAARHERELVLTSRLEEALSLADPLAPGLRGQITARDQQITELQQRLAAAMTAAAERDADLQVAEESIHHLEVEVRDKSGKLEEASVTVEEWRAVIAESQRSILQRDSRIQELEADIGRRRAAVVDSAAQTGEEIALEGPARLLIRTDGNTDFVHVLGRRTRIGRGPDNELVLDTKHVSRYHAVLLAGPVHTSIEDLNSTNGVFVNNRRVARQVLKDGDRVTIGRSEFRFSVRG